MRAMLPTPLWEGEGGGGNSGGGGAGGGGAAAAAAAAAAANGGGGGGDQGGGGGGGQQQQQQADGWKAPEGMTIPAEFMGSSAEDTLGKVLGGLTAASTRAEGLRTQLAAKPSAPDKAEAYTFKPADDVAKYFGDVEKHPVMSVARVAAHEEGLSQKQFEGFVNKVYGELAKSGGLAEPYDPKVEVANYAKVGGFDAATVSQHFQENVAFANGLVQQLTDLPPALAKEAQAELAALTDTAAGNALLRSLQARMASGGIRIAGDPTNQNGALSDADLDKMTADPRIDPRNENHKDVAQRFDPDLRKRYDDGMAKRGRDKYGAARSA